MDVNESLAAQKKRAIEIITVLRMATERMIEPAMVTIVKEYGRDQFLVLVSCILSLRTKDTVSLPASRRLFASSATPSGMVELSQSVIEKLIYPVGFYRQKAKQLRAISALLLEKYSGAVPSDEKELLALPGVGRKTANLVLGEGFEIPALCVDTHVHRISNRLGLVATHTPEETETALKIILPPIYWREYNRLMVMWGQNICVPISPHCSICPLQKICPKIGVVKSR